MRFYLATLMLILGNSFLMADDYSSEVQTFYRDGEAPIGAWVNGADGGEFAKKEINGQAVFAFTTTKPVQKACLSFHGHRKLNTADLPAATDTLRLALKLKAGQPTTGDVKMTWGWRGENMAPLPGVSASCRLSDSEWTNVQLPAAAYHGQSLLSGFYLAVDTPGVYLLSEASLVAVRGVALDPLPRDSLLDHDTVTLSGSCPKEVNNIHFEVTADGDQGKQQVLSREIPARDGRFETALSRSDLLTYCVNTCQAMIPGDPSEYGSSLPLELFAYPAVAQNPLPPLKMENGRLMKEGKPFAFVGINYTRFQLNVAPKRTADFELLAKDVKMFADWGFTALRVTLHAGMIQPKAGVFPDQPEWKEVIETHQCNTHFMEMLDYFIALAAQNGIYCLIDWHEYPTDPYRYFVGGNNREVGQKPGTGIAWLAPDAFSRVNLDLSNPKHLNAVLTTHRWMARHLKGRTGIMGIEIPHNEPHDKFMSVQSNWSRIVTQCALEIKGQDPDRLVFANAANYAHNNEAWAFSWQKPFGLDGYGHHFYIANGPVPVRTDAKNSTSPWMCRDVDATFEYALPALFFPLQTGFQPVYNGEGGNFGSQIFLKETDPALAANFMYEASLFQCYAAGALGHLNWLCIDDKNNDFDIYRKNSPRYAELMKEGPVDWSHADLAVVQNTEAAPSGNGYNYACVPFVKLMLDLHLAPVHYLSDDMIIAMGLGRVSQALDTVEGLEAAGLDQYKGLVVDRRNLDSRIENTLGKLKMPILWVDDMGKLTAEDLIAFLDKNGIRYDTRTPVGIQIAIGPNHLALFRRKGEGGDSRVYPLIMRDKPFSLVDEAGKTVYQGDSATLAREGFPVTLGKWQSAIYQVK